MKAAIYKLKFLSQDLSKKANAGKIFILKILTYVILTLIPLIYLVFMIKQYYIDAPVWDQWDFVPLLQKYWDGNLTFSDLWHQYNEHRLLFPKLIMLTLARISHWNFSWEIGFNLLLAILIFVLLSSKMATTVAANFGQAFTWFIPAYAFLAFSLNQADSWLHSWNLQIFLCLVFVVAGILWLTGSQFNFLKLFLAIICGLVASYSYASGLIFWLVGIMILLFKPRPKKIISLIVWAGVATLVITIYFSGYINMSPSFTFMAIFRDPFRYSQYVLAYLGAPLLPAEGHPQTSIILGLTGLILTFIVSFFLIKSNQFGFFDLIPYLSLSFYVVINALITGFGRAGYSLIQAMSSRYLTISSLFWVALLFLLYLFTKTSKKRRLKFYAYLILITCWLLIIKGSYNSRIFFEDRYKYLAPAQAELLRLEDDDLLQRIYPNLGVLDKESLIRKTNFLRENKLSLFRKKSSKS